MARRQIEDRARYTTGQLGRLLGVSRTTIVRWVEEGRLRARRSVGGWYLVSREEVLAFLFDLGFSKDVPWRIRAAAEVAYERLNEAPRKRPK
jgi:excisionase family DNA binding protein